MFKLYYFDNYDYFMLQLKFFSRILAVLLTSFYCYSASAFESKFFYDIGLSNNSITNDISATDISGGQNGRAGDSVVNLDADGKDSIFDFKTESEDLGLSFEAGLKFSNVYFNGLFIAPAIFYDQINSQSVDDNNLKYKINNRMGLDVSVGYDINNRYVNGLSVFASLGFSDVEYENDASNVNDSLFFNRNQGTQAVLAAAPGISADFLTRDFGTYKNRSSSMIYGFGAKYRLGNITNFGSLDNILVSLEYNVQDVNLDSRHYSVQGGLIKLKNDSKIESLRFGFTKEL